MKLHEKKSLQSAAHREASQTGRTPIPNVPNSVLLERYGCENGEQHDLSGLDDFFDSQNRSLLFRNHSPAVSGTPLSLPRDVKAGMEQAIGHDFSRVKFVESSVASEMGEPAYTQGDTAVFAPGVFSPHTASGKKMIAHELTHVVQQAQGRAAAKDGESYDDSAILEQEANTTANLALSGACNSGEIAPLTPASPAASPMQGGEGF